MYRSLSLSLSLSLSPSLSILSLFLSLSLSLYIYIYTYVYIYIIYVYIPLDIDNCFKYNISLPGNIDFMGKVYSSIKGLYQEKKDLGHILKKNWSKYREKN